MSNEIIGQAQLVKYESVGVDQGVLRLKVDIPNAHENDSASAFTQRKLQDSVIILAPRTQIKEAIIKAVKKGHISVSELIDIANDIRNNLEEYSSK